MVSKKKLFESKFPYIDTFNHEGPVVVSTILDLTSGVFDHLQIMSPMDVDQRVAYTQSIMRGALLKKYKAVMLGCKQLAKDIAGEKCTLGELKRLSIDDFWNWSKSDRTYYERDTYLGLDKCVNF